MGTLHTLPLHERPAARLSYVGSGGVSQVELLALLIGGPDQLDIAQAVVQRFGDTLPQALTEELLAIPGIGQAMAARIRAALELGRRFAHVQDTDRRQISSPSAAADILMSLVGHAEQECFVVLYLDTRNRVQDQEILYRGTLNTTQVRFAEIFRGAVRRNAGGVLVGHNHPSGDPSPSPEDRTMTRSLIQAGKLVEVDVVDHVIVGRTRWVSLRQNCGELWDGLSEVFR
ncbi:MAG TPA: DNA repair protein RadC [Anaerolineae bacterium]|nr:DNA repair protein RadC [Anaerolineae bacterium]HQI83352.1 DNA repair protein RadC [Anaerolineae bacterium]